MKQQHNCSNNQFNQQIENINIELEQLNENMGTLIFQMNPPIVKELNTTNDFRVKSIITNKTTYTDVKNVTGDTWTGTVAFDTTTNEGEIPFKVVLDGNEVIGLIVKRKD